MKNDYSKKEYEMISQVSPHWKEIIDRDLTDSIMPPMVIQIISIDCFIENKTGKAVDSLRRCMNAIRNCDPYRMTKEYDNLIEL